jgi:hypothetical protein
VYSIPQRILKADLVISVAKLKTHLKAGVTLSLKNMVGITNEKRWLPHYRTGSPDEGGDSYPPGTGIERRVSQGMSDYFGRKAWGRHGFRFIVNPLRGMYRRTLRPLLNRLRSDKSGKTLGSGNWHGNDTTWRMALDLNLLLFFATSGGTLASTRQRRYLSLVDGIVAGEGNGPLIPTPKPAGVLVAGLNPVAVDLVCTRMMGFDYRRIPLIRRALRMTRFEIGNLDPSEVRLVSNHPRWTDFGAPFPNLGFVPPDGWLGEVELARPGSEPASAPQTPELRKVRA